MTEEAKKKRDELAEEYCVRPLPEALKKDLIRYKPDNLKIIQRLEYAAYKHGVDAGYQVAMDEVNERIQKLREALEFYADIDSWAAQEDSFIYNILHENSDLGNGDFEVPYSGVFKSTDDINVAGLKARAALKEDKKSQGSDEK